MKEQTCFIKVTEFFNNKKVSYLVNVKEIKRAGFWSKDNNKITYCVELYDDNLTFTRMHFITQKEYERLKKL